MSDRTRQFIEELIRGELDATRPRYGRSHCGLPPPQPAAVANQHIRADRDRSGAGSADHVRGQDSGMEEQRATGVSAAGYFGNTIAPERTGVRVGMERYYAGSGRLRSLGICLAGCA